MPGGVGGEGPGTPVLPYPDRRPSEHDPEPRLDPVVADGLEPLARGGHLQLERFGRSPAGAQPETEPQPLVARHVDRAERRQQAAREGQRDPV